MKKLCPHMLVFCFMMSFAQAQENCDEKKNKFKKYIQDILISKVIKQINIEDLSFFNPQNKKNKKKIITDLLDPEKLFECKLFKDSASQPEFSTPIWAYDRSQNKEYLEKAKAKLKEHQSTLNSIQKKFNVEKEILTSIWAKESKFGTIMGDYPLLQGVSYQSFRTKSNFWAKNVVSAIKIMSKHKLNFNNIKGSWAGAFGHMQFIPTTYDLLAVKDQSGKSIHWDKDSPKVALASAANFLKKSGWNSNLKWGEVIKISKEFNFESYFKIISKKGSKPLTSQKWKTLKVTDQKVEWSKLGDKIYLYSPQGSENPSFLLSSKFKALMKYNNAGAYAIAGLLLAEALKSKPIKIAWNKEKRVLSTPEKKLIQTLLNMKGSSYNVGEVDGRIGKGTRTIIHKFQKEDMGLKPYLCDGQASPSVLFSLIKPLGFKVSDILDNKLKKSLLELYSDKTISEETTPLSFFERQQLQTKLKDNGLYDGGIDGILGSGTQQAVLGFFGENPLPGNNTYMSRTVFNAIMK